MKFIVVDACVATSASSKQTPVSTMCLGFFEEFLKTKNKLVFNKQLKDEWTRHPSKMGVMVLSTLKSRGRILELINDSEFPQIREKIYLIKDKSRIVATVKDLHLIEASLSFDKIIISLDNKAKNNFSFISTSIKEIEEINWINPTDLSENVIGWIVDGSPNEQKRSLGEHAKQLSLLNKSKSKTLNKGKSEK